LDINQEILQRITRVETKLDIFASAKETANEALQTSKDAHRRIEKIEKMIWFLVSTVLSSLILSIMGFLFKGGF
jgi:hypothetical protein